MQIKDITRCLEEFAPLYYQEGYDNAGLICGNENNKVRAALLCIDTTEDVVDEAIKKGCNLIIAHHPIVFSGLKRFNGNSYIERVIIKAIKNDIAIYTAHTNLDNVYHGVNFKIAEKLGLIDCTVLQPKNVSLKKLIVFVPENSAEKVKNAIFKAGAGNMGNYSECSFSTSGIGTFTPNNSANPYVGKKGSRHHENEVKIETILPLHLESAVINAMIQAHPYEEVAYDIIPLSNKNSQIGSGMIGELSKETDALVFLKQVKKKLITNSIRHTRPLPNKIKRVAVCGGSGSFLLNDAIKQKADIFITADFKYHQFFDADNRIIIADIGHYESEQFTTELFYDIIKKKFNTFALFISSINTNPINYL